MCFFKNFQIYSGLWPLSECTPDFMLGPLNGSRTDKVRKNHNILRKKRNVLWTPCTSYVFPQPPPIDPTHFNVNDSVPFHPSNRQNLIRKDTYPIVKRLFRPPLKILETQRWLSFFLTVLKIITYKHIVSLSWRLIFSF